MAKKARSRTPAVMPSWSPDSNTFVTLSIPCVQSTPSWTRPMSCHTAAFCTAVDSRRSSPISAARASACTSTRCVSPHRGSRRGVRTIRAGCSGSSRLARHHDQRVRQVLAAVPHHHQARALVDREVDAQQVGRRTGADAQVLLDEQLLVFAIPRCARLPT